MRVAFVSDKCAPLSFGGYEIRTYELAKALSLNHEVRVYTSLNLPGIHDGGVDFHRLLSHSLQGSRPYSRNPLHSLLFAVTLTRNPFVGWEPDAIVVEAIPYAHLLTMRTWMRHLSCVKVVYFDEYWKDYPYFSGILQKPFRMALDECIRNGVGWADKVVAVSKTTALGLARGYNLADVPVVPHGIDYRALEAFRHTPLRERSFDFVLVARLGRPKRPQDLLRAVSLMKERFRWSGHVAIIGDGPLLEPLSALARSLRIDDRIKFFGHLSEERKFQVLGDSRISVLCSEREGFSASTLEALACGLPAIVSRPRSDDVFGVSDIVISGHNGLYYPVADVEELAEQMYELLQDTSEIGRMGNNAIEIAKQHDWSDIASAFEAILERQAWQKRAS